MWCESYKQLARSIHRIFVISSRLALRDIDVKADINLGVGNFVNGIVIRFCWLIC